jgi:putative endonuclease
MTTSLPPLPSDSSTHTELGSWGEEFAVQVLRRKGYVVLDRNWRTPLGEIDIVCRKSGTLVFVEVKTRRRRSSNYPLQETITHEKERRLYSLGELYQRRHQLVMQRRRYANVRFDLFVVAVHEAPFPYFYHYEGAFSFFPTVR